MRGTTRRRSRLPTRDPAAESTPLGKPGPALPPGDQPRSHNGLAFRTRAVTDPAAGAAHQIGIPQAGIPQTGAPTTGVSKAGVPKTGVPKTEASKTQAPKTGASTQTESPQAVVIQIGEAHPRTPQRRTAPCSPTLSPYQLQSAGFQSRDSRPQPAGHRGPSASRLHPGLDDQPSPFADTKPNLVQPVHIAATTSQRPHSAASKPELTRSGLRTGRDREQPAWPVDRGGNQCSGKPLPSLLSFHSIGAFGSGHRHLAAANRKPTQQHRRHAPGRSETPFSDRQPLADASRGPDRSSFRRLLASVRASQLPTSKPIVDTTVPGATGRVRQPCGSKAGFKSPPAAPSASSEGQSDFARDVRSMTQSIKANMNYPHAPIPKQRVLPKSRAIEALSNLTASMSRTSLPSSGSSSERRASASSRLPARSPPDSAQVPLTAPTVSTSNAPEPQPNEITTAQPSQYWTGRFVALQDQFRSRSCLAAESLNELGRANLAPVTAQPEIRQAGLTHSNTTIELTTLPHSPPASSAPSYPKPVSVSNPLASVSTHRVPPQESSDEDDARTLAVFARLESLCVTDEARQSL